MSPLLRVTSSDPLCISLCANVSRYSSSVGKLPNQRASTILKTVLLDRLLPTFHLIYQFPATHLAFSVVFNLAVKGTGFVTKLSSCSNPGLIIYSCVTLDKTARHSVPRLPRLESVNGADVIGLLKRCNEVISEMRLELLLALST